MPIAGFGLHILIALFFAVHVIRSGQPMYWLLILFFFPLLGSIVYFVAIYLPDSRLESGAKKAVMAAARSLDPTRELRAARADFEYTPTAQNQMRLALALLEAGDAEEAAVNYEACLTGPFASDREIKFSAARAFVESGRYARAASHLEEIRAIDAHFRVEQVSILLARALAGAGRDEDAKAEFESAIQRFGSFDAYAEYAIWSATRGDQLTTARLQAEIDRITKRWHRHTRALHQPLLQRLAQALANKR